LRELLQKPPYVVAVVEFCVYLIHLSLWYCKSRQRSFMRFLVLCISWSQKVALRFIVLLFSLCGDIVAGVQTVSCNHAWSRFSGVSYGTVNSLQTLCWEIGDKSRSWNKNLFLHGRLLLLSINCIVWLSDNGQTTDGRIDVGKHCISGR